VSPPSTGKPPAVLAPGGFPNLQENGSTMIVGIISDTHGLLRPEACRRLAGVHHIIHAGDIGRPEVIAELRKLAPTTAIRGNIDRDAWARDYAKTACVRLAGRSIHVLHNLKELNLDPSAVGIDVVVSGHSHRPGFATAGGVLYLNPGSAGPRRFTLPVTVATLELGSGTLRPHIHDLGLAGRAGEAIPPAQAARTIASPALPSQRSAPPNRAR